GLTAITIPDSVTNLGSGAFSGCRGLRSFSFGNGITEIAGSFFSSNTNLQTVTIGAGVTNVGTFAFYNCTGLTDVFFKDDAPGVGEHAFDNTPATVFYSPGTMGWPSVPSLWATRPTALWLWRPIVPGDGTLGILDNHFGFTIHAPSGMVVVVEACTDLTQTNWLPVATNTLVDGSFYFADPHWTNFLGRYYRMRSP
ncbi:MAG: leucine-rich repeat domain-containing protein, partial [Spartobacteria bacterium]|nr:leucine-rich repeat domain-containing protein [Spartobacteria bacterium]